MQGVTTRGAVAPVTQPGQPSAAGQATGLHARATRPRQRAAHCLGSVGKQMLKSVGKLFQKSKAPSQGGAPTHSAALRPPRSDDQAAAEAARAARTPGSRIRGGDGLRQSLLRPSPAQASSSGTAPAGTVTEEGSELAALAPASLQRSRGGRFDLQEGRLMRGAQPANTIALGADGKADFSAFSGDCSAPLLGHLLAKPGQAYLACDSQPAAQEHLLLEPSGHLLHLANPDGALSLLRTSQPLPRRDSAAPGLVSLAREAGQVRRSDAPAGTGYPLPAKALVAHVSGVYDGAEGERLRVHENRLYHFDPARQQWVVPPGCEAIAFNQLALGGNGSVYAKSDDVLVDLTSPLMPHLEAERLTAFSVAADNHAVVLSGASPATVLLADLTPGASGPKQQKTLRLAGDAEPAAVGLSAGRLFVADTQGRLHSIERSRLATGGETLDLALEAERYSIGGRPLGGEHAVTGFLSGEGGQLHALVQDRAGSTHAHALDEHTGVLAPGWNLTDTLVVDDTRGVGAPVAPEGAQRLALDRAGSVGLADGRVHYWDDTAQGWRPTGVTGVERLQRGSGSQAFVLKGGALLALDASPQHKRLPFGESSPLAPAVRTLKVALGQPVEGLEGRCITAFAMVNATRFVALDDQQRLTTHQPGKPPAELKFPGLPGAPTALALDEQHNLCALAATGEVFRLPKAAWQAAPGADTHGARWEALATPPGTRVADLYSNDDNVLSAQFEGEGPARALQLKGAGWQPLAPRPAEQNSLADVFKRLRGGQKTRRIPGTGGTARLDVTVAGRNNVENSHRPSTGDFVRAHVYKNTMETPRWMKNVGYHLQHRYQGREGLRTVYEQQARVYKQLELVHEVGGPAPAAGEDLQARIARLNLGPAGAEFASELEAFRDTLEQHAHAALVGIGQRYGGLKNLRTQSGVLNLHGELARPAGRGQFGKALQGLGERLNFKSSGHDLVQELDAALARVAPSAANNTRTLLRTLKDHGLQLSHQKADIPLGQRRDRSDNLDLIKARLALDVVTLNGLAGLLDQAETASEAGIERLRQRLATLRDTTYGENPLKRATDMGFTNSAGLERGYDAIKSFLKAFKKPDHATSVNLRAATGSASQAELASRLKGMLKQLEHADDEISLQRSYGLNLSTPFITLADKATGPWPSASATGNRNYTLTAERGEAGITVYLFSEAAGSVSAGVGAGKDYWPGFFDENDPARGVSLGNRHSFTPNFRLGVDATATAAASQRVGVAFRVADEDIGLFVDDLFSGKVNPLDLLLKASDHETYTGRRMTFDITAGASAELRAGINLSETGSTPLSAVARLGIAATVSVNLLNYTRQRVEQRNDKVTAADASKNRPRALNSVSVGVQARGQLNGTVAQTRQHAAESAQATPSVPATRSAASAPGMGATLSADSKTTKRVKFRFQKAQPLTDAGLSTLAAALKGAFKDAAATQALAGLAAMPAEGLQVKLDALNATFAQRPAQNDTQYKALRELKRATVQHASAAKQHSVLENARFESSYTNLSRLDEQSMATRLISAVKELGAPSNAQRVAQLMARDRTLAGLLKELQGSDGTLARVRLEPKDALMDTIDAGSQAGTLTEERLGSLLEDRNAMRIRALTVYHTANQPEAFTLPTPLASYNSGASLSVTRAVGRIVFAYGQDQDTPIGYTFDGEQALPSQALKDAAAALNRAGRVLKDS